MSSRVLVTGANGQLGKTIKELFEDNKDGIDFAFVSKMELDITSKASIYDFPSISQFDYCINCAAYTNVEQAEKTPDIAYSVNSIAVKNLSEICKENNITLIHISTDYVFDGKKEHSYTVDDIPSPLNEYGKSKLQGEEYIKDILEKYFIIRTSWLYSKKHGHNFYKTILKKAKAGDDLYITDNQKSCPTDTESLSNFIYNIIKSKLSNYGTFHFSDDIEMTWYDFAEAILKENQLFGKINLVKANNYVTFAKRPKYSVLAKAID